MDALINRFGVDRKNINTMEKRYNIAPSQDVEVITRDNPIVLSRMRWGFIPHWADSKNPEIQPINARKESLHKNMYNYSFNNYRCIIPASGFYEWKKTQGGKVPHHISVKGQELFGMAGIVSRWSSKRNPDDTIYSFAIITVEPNEMMSNIHDRMPSILLKEQEDTWLDPESDPDTLLDILHPYPGEMTAYSVSKYVNSPQNTGKECIEPTDEPYREKEQGSLDDYFT